MDRPSPTRPRPDGIGARTVGSALRSWAALLIVTLALLPAAGAAAERAGDLAELSLEQLMALEVTSVSKKPERRSAAAAAVYVITEEDIRRLSRVLEDRR